MTQLQKEDVTVTENKKTIELRKVPEMIFLFLLDLVLPALIASIIIFYLSGPVHIPPAYQSLTFWIYAVLLTLLSAIIALSWFEIPRLIRKKDAKPSRWIMIGASGLVIPVGVLLLANFTSLPTGETYLAHYLPASLMQGVTVPAPPSISATIFQSTDLHTKTLGITALGTIHTTGNLAQLVQVLTQQTSLLNQPDLYQTLSNAIASYGVEARPSLVAAFQQWSQAISPAPDVPSSSLYDQYFSDSIQSLRSAISSQDEDINARNNDLQELNSIETKLQSDLGELKLASNPQMGGDSRLGFILDTFNRMAIQQDPDILTLARSVAANPVYPAINRQQALLLIGKLGSQDDLPLLLSYLQNDNETIKAGSLEAIILLNQKMGATSQTTSK